MAVRTFSAAGISAGAAGLQFITSSTFSAVSAVNINNVFSANFRNYRVVMTVTADTLRALTLRLRASGTDNSSNNYKVAGLYVRTKTSTAVTGYNGPGLISNWILGDASTELSAQSFDIYAPEVTEHTNYLLNLFSNYGTDDGYAQTYAGAMSVTTSYDGFSVIAAAGNITGSVRVYGYRNS